MIKSERDRNHEQKARRAYVAPRIVELGSVRELTANNVVSSGGDQTFKSKRSM